MGPTSGPRRLPRWRRYQVALYALAGLAVVDLGVVLTRPGWGRYDTEVYPQRLAVGRHKAWGVAVVGGSPVSEGVDVRQLGGLVRHGLPLGDAVNLGLPGGTTADTWLAVRHGLPHAPRLLVYGVTASDLNDGRAEPSGARTIMTSADVGRWWRHRPDRRGWAIRHFAQGRLQALWQLYHRRAALQLWAAAHVERVAPGSCPEAAAEAAADRAYQAALGEPFAPRPEMRGRRLDELKRAGAVPPFGFLAKFRLGGYLSYLGEIIDWCAARGVELVLLDMPVSADLDQALHPGEYGRYREALADVARRRGVRVIWATREAVGLGDADFADLVHLNACGSAKLARWLRGELTDRASGECGGAVP